MPETSLDTKVSPLPAYVAEHLASLDCPGLLQLLAADEDRAPRAVIDECADRGDAMIDCLEALLGEERYWSNEVTRGEWWRLLHAVMILGLIRGARAGSLLVAYMRRMEQAQDHSLQDWFSGYWPALFRNKPQAVVPALRTLAQDRGIDWYMRIQAVEAVIAAGGRTGSADLDAALDWTAAFAADETEDWSFRLCTGGDLLDFPRERHRPLLENLAARQSRSDCHFAKEEVIEAYDNMEDTPDWGRRDDPWCFYSPKTILARQERWAHEDAVAQGRDDDEDESLDDESQSPYVRSTPKIGRNDPCPCGSGKKYKKCCLAAAQT